LVRIFTRFNRLSSFSVAALCLFVTASSASKATAQDDVQLQVGIIQRFGDRAKDVITLKAPAGDRLTLRFKDNYNKGKEETLVVPGLKLEMVMQPISPPEVYERVVFSTHRSFETAEEQGQKWRAQGVDIELAQPDRWQVWAKRDTYNSPLLRRLLLQSLESKGIKGARLESKALKEVARPVWTINGKKYSSDFLDIVSGTGVINVDREKDDIPNRAYAGALRMQPNAYRNYSIVNWVGLETYLRGVVPNEIGGWAAPAVLESQAILARTYVLRNLRRFIADNYQICATTQCQVYYGLSGAVDSTDRAIAATRGLVLTYENELVDALYFSTSGGTTASFEDVWRGWNRPYLRPVIDAPQPIWDLNQRPLSNETNFRAFIAQKNNFNETGTNMFRWRYPVPLAQVNKEVQSYLKSISHPKANFKTIQSIQVTQRSQSGRIQEMVVTTDTGKIELHKDDILNAFEAPASLLFHVDALTDKTKGLQGFAFVGGGFGHGVGFSQVGSYNLGKIGWTSAQMLGFYFPGTQLQPFNNSITIWLDRSQATAQQPFGK
jgi:SpoIID/LytB domain protein